jgi:hypothetical protein
MIELAPKSSNHKEPEPMVTRGAQHMTINEFSDRFHGALPGTSFIYFTGHLAKVRDDAKSEDNPNFKELDRMADMAYELSRSNRLCLTQRRVGPNEWQYIATKRAA